MRIEILTLFPEMFSALDLSILGRAQKNGILELRVSNIRDYSKSKHKNTDDYPFGGGAGMLMSPQPIADAIRAVAPDPFEGKRLYMSPRGTRLNVDLARELSREKVLMILCGRYEGVDERVLQKFIDLEVSIGDYVLTGGELPAMVLIDCVARFVPGVLGGTRSMQEESFSQGGLLEYPQYTRPRVFEGLSVPEVLLNGDHASIARWRRDRALETTFARRPELLDASECAEEAEKRGEEG